MTALQNGASHQQELQPTEGELRAFLQDYVQDDLHLVRINPELRQAKGRWFGNDLEAATAWAIDWNKQGWNLYWTPNRVRPGLHKKAAKDDVTSARFAHVDVDPPKNGQLWEPAAVERELAELQLAPSFIVFSGGGLQAFWRLEEDAANWQAIEAINRGIRDRFKADNCQSIDHVMRLPGTVNWPDAKKRARGRVPTLARILEPDDGIVYAAHDLAAAFPERKEGQPRRGGGAPHAGPAALLEADDLKRCPPRLRAMIEEPDKVFKEPDRSGWAFGIACEMIRSGYGEEQILGILLNPLNPGSEHIAEQPDQRRAALRALERAQQEEKPRRSFEDLLEEAQTLEAHEIDLMEGIVNEAKELAPMRRDAIFRAIKNATGVPLGTLRQQMAEENEADEPDHLDLARLAIGKIGRENLICADAFVWRWNERGVWEQQDDRAIKQAVQAAIEAAEHDVTAPRVTGVSDVLKSEIYVPRHQFNQGNPETVNCLNGELELVDGRWQLRPHRREHYRTTQVPVEFDPSADAPLFRAFLGQVFHDDEDRDDKARAVLELMGYTLMSHARHERFVMLIGAGANGKSVLLAVLEGLLGSENVAGVQPANFDRSFQRAHLHQKLANIVTELKQGEVIADAELKAITSGEPATVEHKYEKPFVMRPFSTCWFGTNHMPHTRDFSDALFRRAVILRFNRVFGREEQDPLLKEKLLEELPGVLNMALAAYAQALRAGFTEPQSSEEAKREWRLEADQVAQFVEDGCEVNPENQVQSSRLFQAYLQWAQENGIRKTLGHKGFAQRLAVLQFPTRRSSRGNFVLGLQPLEAWEREWAA